MIKYEKFQLDNGLKVILLENHRLPIVVAQASVARVRFHEAADQIGIASLMGSLLEEGTPTRTGPEIAKLIEDTGGGLNMTSSGGSFKVLTDDTELGLAPRPGDRITRGQPARHRVVGHHPGSRHR